MRLAQLDGGIEQLDRGTGAAEYQVLEANTSGSLK